MAFANAVRRAFSWQKSQQQTGSIYIQSPSEQYHRSSQSEPTRPQYVSLPPYQREVGIYTQSASEVYMRRGNLRHSQSIELPRYQRAVISISTQSDIYAPINEHVPEYYQRENVPDEKYHEGQPPQYQR